MARGLFAQEVAGDAVSVDGTCACVCPLSLDHVQQLSAHWSCFLVCRAAYPAFQSSGNYSPAKQKTGVGFGQQASPVSSPQLIRVHRL